MIQENVFYRFIGFKNMFTPGLWDSRICLQQIYGIQEYVYNRFMGFKNMFTPPGL